MGWYERNVFNWALDRALDVPVLHDVRRQHLELARGVVVEIGTGTGLNFPHYPASVRQITSVTLEPTLDRRALTRANEGALTVRHIQGSATELPLETHSIDTIICTFLLCSVDNPELALAEFRRVLKPEGLLLVLEHIRAPSGWRRWAQPLCDPLVRIFACGCSVMREPQNTIVQGGFFPKHQRQCLVQAGSTPLHHWLLLGSYCGGPQDR